MVQTTLEIIGLIFGLLGSIIAVSNEFSTLRKIGIKISKIAPWSQWDLTLLDQGLDTLPERRVRSDHDAFLPMFDYLTESGQPTTRPSYTEEDLKFIDEVKDTNLHRLAEDLMELKHQSQEGDKEMEQLLNRMTGFVGQISDEEMYFSLSDDGNEIVFNIPRYPNLSGQSFNRSYYEDRLNAEIDRFFVHTGTLLIGMAFAFQGLSLIF
ncbi:hypothetical protein ACFOZ7_15330 [Natribaculum luteum]|uniref:Uncharacterized protein n=1 Tax=Natribaculum luteum TaxID=1586232 RepID=A0ABD5P1W1_9EURY|nr:hypothetical protein [Natribaculum luteum]